MEPVIFVIGEDNLDPNWICASCYRVMVNASSACREQHSFCRNCLEPWLNQHASCPTCRQPVTAEELVRSRVVDDQISRLQVNCPKAAALSGQDQGSCNWTGRVGDIPHHDMHECGMVEVECRHCTTKLMRSELAGHEDSCDCRPLPCAHCQTPQLARDMDVHVLQCGNFEIDCPHGCTAKVPRRSLPQHEQACPEVTVHCSFAGHGCGRRLKRKRMEEHANEAAVEHEKISILARELEECKRALEETKEKLKEKDSTISALVNVTQQQQQQILPLTTEHKQTITIPAISQKVVSDPAAHASSYSSKPFPLSTRRGVYRMRLEAEFTFGQLSLSLHLLNVDRAADPTPIRLFGSKVTVTGGASRHDSAILCDFLNEERDVLQPGGSCEIGVIPSPFGATTLSEWLLLWLHGDALSLRLKLRITVGEWCQVEMATP